MDGENFYAEVLSPEELKALAIAARLQGVDSEIAIVRVMVRRCVAAGEVEAARRGVEALARLLRAQHELDVGSAQNVASNLDRVLDRIGEELGLEV